MPRWTASRRQCVAGMGLGGLTALAGGAPVPAARGASALLPDRVAPLPLADVQLLPSFYLDAVEANRRYLLSLSPDRLLHHFRAGAGLPPKAAAYAGWESDTIAGHTLGHYLSALALIHAQTGDPEPCRRAGYIVDELAACQRARGTGYVAGLRRKRPDGAIVDGEEMFREVAAGDIRSGGFDLNGAWSPLYNIHKTLAGLMDVHRLCGNGDALTVAAGLAGYFRRLFARLSDAQLQDVLGCEYGGLNESFAELSNRTGDAAWLSVAERLYDRKVLDPLAAGHDDLPNLHANTQVPKLIGLARIHELTGRAAPGRAARFFWDTVTTHHSYVIGGNADREYFFAPDAIAAHVTEQTCEHCNSYNMLKLTRQLYGWGPPDAAMFDWYERTHLNHVMAAHDPATGMFTYMTPLLAGAKRDFSTPFDDFWCCVGSGMESHAKHGDSVWWSGTGALLVNLFVPSRARWAGGEVELATGYPLDGEVRVRVLTATASQPFTLGVRIPGWAGQARLTVNGAAVAAERANGYALVRRRWRPGDVLALFLPLDLRLEPAPGDPDTVAVLRGPLVLAADMGSADAPQTAAAAAAPALVGNDLLAGFRPGAAPALYRTTGLGRPADMDFRPFFSAYDRRSAVYFKRFTDAQWETQKVAFAAEQARLADLAARSVDVMHLGEMQAEHDHGLTSAISYPVVYRGRNGRDARSGGFFEFAMKTRPGPLVLEATYWGEERKRLFDILVDGQVIATQTLEAEKSGAFVEMDYPIPETLTRGKPSLTVRFQPHAGHTAGPVFGVRLFTPKVGTVA